MALAADAGHGERIDAVTAWPLEHGLHWVARVDAAVDAGPEAAPGWTVDLHGPPACR
ncbi:hypothetical protein [Nonomuraea sp. NPDC049480]|uniref:hypothetical protein n=1 Tax=Nonomuraea sp. NPDC049480 TaxID=3364353 RepID=UPI00378F7EF0